MTYELVRYTLILDPTVPKPVPLKHGSSDKYIERLNKINEFCQQGLVTIKCEPIYKLAPRAPTQREYTVERYRELRAAEREFDDFPLPAAVPGDRPRPQSLREFAAARDIPYPSKLAEKLWYEQFRSPHSFKSTHLPEIRAHYARIGDRVEKKLPGDEYIVSETACVKWWKDQPLAASAPWDYRGDRSYHASFEGYGEIEPQFESGSDTHMNVPLEQFKTGAVAPTRTKSEIDFLGLDPETLTKKEKVWWAGEVYRINLRKDGMRRVSGRMYEEVGAFFGISRETVKRSARNDEPLGDKKPSQKGSGFVGISGDWGLKHQRKLIARWIVPWLLK